MTAFERRLAQRQEEESLRRIDRTVGAIEPAIVVITSALAGVILLSVMTTGRVLPP